MTEQAAWGQGGNPADGVESKVPSTATPGGGTLRHYVAIARPDHWIKHIFIVPGILAAAVLVGVPDDGFFQSLFFGFASAALAASANYTINEWLDAAYDRHHPLKKRRPAAAGLLLPALVYLQYGVLVAAAVALGVVVSIPFAGVIILFIASGAAYNIAPLRTKDRTYLDVLTESFNNPIRLTLGWMIVDGASIPPLSLALAYWSGGAFLMATKRLAEYRYISAISRDSLVQYRRSFRSYSEERLTLSCFLYGLLGSFFVAAFLVKYRAEYVVSFPPLAVLFTYYLHLGLKPQSIAQTPEKLYREPKLQALVLIVAVVLLIATFVEMPFVEALLQSHFTDLRLE